MKKYILLFIVLFCLLSLPSYFVLNAEEPDLPPTNGTHLSQNLPYKSIEDAVRASGGTYGVIDTSNPDAGSNFVQTIFDQGLTTVDGDGDCSSMNIRSGITFSCALGKKVGAYYYYEGKKGEKVVVTVSTKDFTPEIDILDANGEVEYSDNKQKKGSFTITKTFLYTGRYTFEVRTRYYDEIKADGSFTIGLTSDKSNIQPDIRKDSLIEGNKYSIYELNQNQSKIARKFLVDAFVKNIYKQPYCPPSVSCKPSMPLNIIISDDKDKKVHYSNMGSSDAILYLGGNNKTFEVGKKYQFEVSVQNGSNTNIPSNEFRLISIKNDANGNTIQEDGLVEGQTYSVKKLIGNTSTVPRRFFTEAYVMGGYFKNDPCPIECPPQLRPYAIIADTMSKMNTTNISVGYSHNIPVEIGKKYIFELTVQETSQFDIIQNNFELVSVKELNGENIVSPTPLTTITPPPKTIFVIFENWFRNLFK